MHPVSRREFLQRSGATVVVGVAVLHGVGPVGARPALAQEAGFLSAAQRSTLGAAVAQIVPASGPDDWSAADLGVVDYIDNLLSGFGFLDGATGAIYPGGPDRNASSSGPGFYTFQDLTRVKKIGWEQQVSAWQSVYTDGLAQLDSLAPGGFAAAPSAEQIAILEGLDASGSDFFAALFDHTMEGTYSHPVYGGNQGYEAWKAFGFAGDVHGVRYSRVDSTWSSSSPWLPTDPGTGQGAWTIYGGYAPDEMNDAGTAATEQPTVTPPPTTTNW
jgi:gluconate 2-dehydrogenase gamma chain